MSESTSSENSNSKFSLVSWLVRIILYGSVFASVFLPSYVAIELRRGCSSQTKHWFGGMRFGYCGPQVPARNDLGGLNRSQQAYHIEHNKFADSIAELGIGIKTENSQVSYRIVQRMVPVKDLNMPANYEQEDSMTIAIGQRKIEENQAKKMIVIAYSNYLGIVYTLPQTSASGETEIITRSGLCEMTEKNPLPTTMPKLINGAIQCPNGANKLGE